MWVVSVISAAMAQLKIPDAIKALIQLIKSTVYDNHTIPKWLCNTSHWETAFKNLFPFNQPSNLSEC